MEPCTVGNKWALAAFLVFAVLSHGRGTILLVREVCGFIGRKRKRPRWYT